MGISITHLGSGSRGNSTLLSTEDCNILVDSGFSLVQMEKRLGVAGINPMTIDSIVVKHHHKDHSCSALRASKKWGSSLRCNLGTATRMGWRPIEECATFGNLERVECRTAWLFAPKARSVGPTTTGCLGFHRVA